MPKYQHKKTRDVYFMVYSGTTGSEFAREIDAYKYAVNNRPANVFVFSKTNAYEAAKIAEFPEEPFWWESDLGIIISL